MQLILLLLRGTGLHSLSMWIVGEVSECGRPQIQRLPMTGFLEITELPMAQIPHPLQPILLGRDVGRHDMEAALMAQRIQTLSANKPLLIMRIFLTLYF